MSKLLAGLPNDGTADSRVMVAVRNQVCDTCVCGGGGGRDSGLPCLIVAPRGGVVMRGEHRQWRAHAVAWFGSTGS
jgi:hypothetical protein